MTKALIVLTNKIVEKIDLAFFILYFKKENNNNCNLFLCV